jgi:3-phenylpropionate/trans-cinnamate dioxygenase ferredoxin reductase component
MHARHGKTSRPPDAKCDDAPSKSRPTEGSVADGKTFLIVGAGMAGAKAAETLREEGFDGRIVMLGAEPEAPYERPPLSKGYLMGDAAREEARVHDSGFYDEHDVELEAEVTVERLVVAEHRVELLDGRSIAYDRALLATGAEPRRLPLPGAELEGVHVLRTLPDSDVLRAVLESRVPVAIVGAGWIGCEVAAAARHHGAEVTLLETASQPLEGVLGAELGAFFAGVHRDHGVRLVTGAQVEAIEGSERVEAIRVGGERIECAAVVMGVGVSPRTALAEQAGLEVSDGVVVDERLATSDPDVFAAGDVASSLRPRYGRHVRVEHWANALEQGPAAARAMLGSGEPFDALPYFFSDQYDVGMEYVGLHSPSDRVVITGKPEEQVLQAHWLDDAGRVTAGMHVNDWDAIEPIKARVGTVVDPADL